MKCTFVFFLERSDWRIWDTYLLLRGNRSWCAFDQGVTLPAFKPYLYMLNILLLVSVLFSFLSSHVGHKNQNMDNEFKNHLWVHWSTDNTSLTCFPPLIQFRAYFWQLHTDGILGLLRMKSFAHTLGLEFFLSTVCFGWVHLYGQFSVIYFASSPSSSVVQHSRGRGQGSWGHSDTLLLSSVLVRS